MTSGILITGAAGFIGSHLVEALLARGEHVIGLDNFDPFYDRARKESNLAICRSHPNAAKFTFIEGDICDEHAIREAAQHAHSIIHIAAKAGVRPSIEDPVGYTMTNVLGTMRVLEAARESGCSRVVVASSSSVYGNNPKVPFSEEDDVSNPISPYAATKKSCELICHAHQHLTGMPTACLRFFTVFGPRQRPDLAIAKFLKRARDGEPIPVFGDGSTSRDYTFIADIVDGVLASHDRIGDFGYRVWNLGGSSPVTLSELLDTIADVTGQTLNLDRKPMQPGDVNRTWADLSRAKAELDFAPTTSLRDGIAVQWASLDQRATTPGQP